MKDFTKARYLAVVKAFPQLKSEQTQVYFMLILTFVALSFLGIFAINPTLTTIAELQKKLADSTFVDEQLKTKITNLSSLRTQYDELTTSWPIVNAAVPDTPLAAYVLGQVQTIAKDTGVSIVDLETFEVTLNKRSIPIQQKESSFTFSVSVTGSPQSQLQFLQALTQFDRVISLESITYSSEEKQILTVLVRTYFMP
jgi:Tfp pilus assembly protein PilO